MRPLPQVCRCLALLLCVALAGCAPLNKYSYETFRANPAHDHYSGSTRSDLLALVYADYVAKLLEGRSTGARITREISDSTLALGTQLTAAHETLNITAETLAKMGVGISVVRELQGIFNARGRSEAFADAAYLIRQAQAEYRAFNPTPSPHHMTENGATLVRRVDSALHAARKTLIGRMPSLLDLKQANQPMTEAGATRRGPGTPEYLPTETGDVPAPPLPPLVPPLPPGPGVTKPEKSTPEEVLTKQGQVQVSIDKLTGTALPLATVTVMDRLDPPPATPDGKPPKYTRDKTGLRKLVGKTRKIEDLDEIEASLAPQ